MPERWRRRAMRALVGGGLLVAAYYFLWGGEYSVFDIRELQETRRSAVGRVDSLQALVDSVAWRADSLSADSLAIERLARERYGFIRDGERLYRFVKLEPEEEPDRLDPRNPGD